MPSISVIKERFALAASIEEREQVVAEHAIAGSRDWYYYQGLLTLQKLRAEFDKDQMTTKSRDPSPAESDLMQKMQKLLEDFERAGEDHQRYKELKTRYHLLTYPIDTARSLRFIGEELQLDTPSEQVSAEQDAGSRMNYPTSLDNQLIDPRYVVRQCMQDIANSESGAMMNIEPVAIPVALELLKEGTSKRQEEALLRRLLQQPQSSDLVGVSERLAQLWREQELRTILDTWPLYNLTLDQMNTLQNLLPNILEAPQFVQTYINKLVPEAYVAKESTNSSVDYWDDQERTLEQYLKALSQFVETLPNTYSELKSKILFHQLRIDIVRNECEEARFVNYLHHSRIKDVPQTKAPFSGGNNFSPVNSINLTIPFLGDSKISYEDDMEVIKAYLTCLISSGKLSSLESLSSYFSFNDFLKPFEATVLLTHSEHQSAEWSRTLGDQAFESLVERSELTFTESTEHLKCTRRPDDAINLTVRFKNMAHITVRVYEIDLFNYWRRHPESKEIESSNIDLNGVYPAWEKQFDFSDKPSIRVFTENFTFGPNGLAEDIFNGRGAWIIDFVGGRDQCRAIVQKGHLQPVIQETSAGHLIEILDEDRQVLTDTCKIWNGSSYFEPGETGSILLPYRLEDAKESKVLLTMSDGYSQPVDFFHQKEIYTFDGYFYVNSEALLPNKKAEVVVLPELRVHGQEASLSLLEDIALVIEAVDAQGVKSRTTVSDLTISKHQAIQHSFTVPNSLSAINFTLTANVKCLSAQQPSQRVEIAEQVTVSTSESNSIISTHLRSSAEEGYFIYVCGKNGEPIKNHVVEISLKHKMLTNNITVHLQSDNDGVIALGQIKDVAWLHTPYKFWNVAEYITELPPFITARANTEFKVPYQPTAEGRQYSMFQTGFRGNALHDVSAHVHCESTFLTISGLQEGKYKLFLADTPDGAQSIECTIIDTQASHPLNNKTYWASWLFGRSLCGEGSGSLVTSPLSVEHVASTDEKLQFQVNNGNNYPALVLLTTSTFVPLSSYSLSAKTVKNRTLRWLPQSYSTIDTPSIFMSGRKLSEEHQYIMNRQRAVKRVGSTLTKPSLLINPMKHASTDTSARHLAEENDFVHIGKKKRKVGSRYFPTEAAYCCAAPMNTNYMIADTGFLDYQYRVLQLQPGSNGELHIDRSELGDGNILQLVVLSGEQRIAKRMVLEGASLDLQTTNLCQQAQGIDKTKAYIQPKCVRVLNDNDSFTLPSQHKWEMVNTFQKLFHLIEVLSPEVFSADLAEFSFLVDWPTYDVSRKLETYRYHDCYELALWLKHKDQAFFTQYILPTIQSKIQKSFMDWYLVDGDLTAFAENMHSYRQLSIIEKALLAKSVPSSLPSILQDFKDTYEATAEVLDDRNFEAVLAGGVLETLDQDIGMALYDAPIALETASRSYVPPPAMFGSAPTPRAAMYSLSSAAPRMAMRMQANENEEPENDESEEETPSPTEEGDQKDMEEQALREQVKRHQKKEPFKFVKPTSEWIEKGYYKESEDQNALQASQFWIDYLASETSKFLTGTFIHATRSFTEIMSVLALLSLPFENAYQTQLSSEESGHLTISSSGACLLFHRALEETTTPAPANPTVLLGQSFFLNEGTAAAANDSSINPDDFQPSTDYKWHLAVSNISSERCICQITAQIPTGAIPTGNTQYCISKSIGIEPYSTWHDVIGSFYFPASGNFTVMPITAAQDNVLLNQTQPLNITVDQIVYDSQKERPWSLVAAKGSSDDVIQYLGKYKNLRNLDMSLIGWRMMNATFASEVFKVLRQRRFYTESLWQYGVHHGLGDVVRELLEENGTLLKKAGYVLDTPLVSARPEQTGVLDILDYYPLIHARAHRLGSKHEILNKQFAKQYDAFLEYLGQKHEATGTDLTVICTYLLIQDRIEEASAVYRQASQLGVSCQIQFDYIGAYLRTRTLVKDVDSAFDLSDVREITKKYHDCGSLRWRELFASLEDYIDEISSTLANDNLTTTYERRLTKSMQKEPLLDLQVENNQLVLQYANIQQQVQIRYYKMDVEIMFSNSPFMAHTGKTKHQDYDWIKPNYIEWHMLEFNHQSETSDGFEMIGLAPSSLETKTIEIPESMRNSNMMIEVIGEGFQRQQIHFAHQLTVHVSEIFGLIRVGHLKQVLAGAYVKVYARLKNGRVEFWKDGYTGLNGTFDYVNITEGNALVAGEELQKVVETRVDKFSILVVSENAGAVVREAFPPVTI
ncbi:uncharacterized protein BYT42DRAFT_643716 [Radiomyces spectabilis]|uniref:uncharacterized protein n=1 Tax=Radiomyces spectabilis TaxID=64574 RepID=UPI002220F552|nr:uncharacterized protein BYT42DRAFT_643716 [Radiomyces spectabilis]KAI8384988.1 hypothetical protein BYT42DRAFT_643716 [Radiomyces spectabilis]